MTKRITHIFLLLVAVLPAVHAYRDLEAGTFLTRDPIGYGDGPNVYCYVHCNPITHFDAFGLADIHTWYPTDGFGHASVGLDDKTHISWWPQADDREPKFEDASGPLANIYTVDAVKDQTFMDDKEMEGSEKNPREPDSTIHVDGLNEGAMKDWFDAHKADSGNKWSSLQSNCSTISYSAMRAGGAAVAMIKMEGKDGASVEMEVPIWTPQLVEAYAQEIANRDDPQSDEPVFLDPAIYAKQFTTPAEGAAGEAVDKVEEIIVPDEEPTT